MTENPKHAQAAVRLPLWLVPPAMRVHVAAVFKAGLDANPDRWAYNWRDNPVLLSDYLSAAERHHLALQEGEWIDEKSGCHHAACAIANYAIILDAQAAGTLVDDLPRVKTDATSAMLRYSEQYQKSRDNGQ
jgi:hypothetical protein